MLFSSFEFVCLFLPMVVVGFYLIASWGGRQAAIMWLVVSSLFFYGWWNPAFVFLIIGSIVFNYFVGLQLKRGTGRLGNWILAFGISANLCLLGYFKYAGFFADNLNRFAGAGFDLGTIALPLAISFFTFQQIAYLADARRGDAAEYSFLHYCLFVTFFPQLIAGPIVHHKEMMPQFEKSATFGVNFDHLAQGLTIFVIGLSKKLIIADALAPHADWVFNGAEAGHVLTFAESWGGALAYTGQIYFDFSGYSDMAIGLAWMFGIRLPLNFFSPYKAKSIIDFWRTWHMTLSRFLRDFLYIPLGGSRKGPARRHTNLMITMLLGGLWHGAGWTFVVWGGLHGLYLIVNHAWRWLAASHGLPALCSGRTWGVFCHALTFAAIVVAWVFFRAQSFDGALAVLHGMSGANGLGEIAKNTGHFGKTMGFVYVFAALALAFIAPNAHQLMDKSAPGLETDATRSVPKPMAWLNWRPSVLWFAATQFMLLASLYTMMRFGYEEFIYAFF